MLILLIQATVGILGAIIVFEGTRQALSHRIGVELLHHNTEHSDVIAERLRAEINGPIVLGTPEWETAQSVIENVEVPHGGTACLLSLDGTVLCHPDLADVPGLRGASIAAAPPSGMHALRRLHTAQADILDGHLHVVPGGDDYVSTTRIDELGVNLAVLFPTTGLISIRSPVMRPVWLAAGVTGFGLIVVTALMLRWMGNRFESTIQAQNRSLEAEVARRVDQAVRLRDALIVGLATLADYRDSDTGRHLERITEYTGLLAEALRAEHPEIDDDWIALAKLASSMHDIGKVGIADAVLLKPGPLSPAERSVMERHPSIGADTLIAIRRQLGSDPLIDMSIQITLGHHEWWDGAGYPFGLSGDEIALPARIVAVADAYDAITSARVYKGALTHGEAVAQIVGGAGTRFDPGVVRAFLSVADAFDYVRSSHLPPGSGAEPLAA